MPVIEIPFSPRDYQRPFIEAIQTKRYGCIVWARRHGKDLTCWNYAIRTASQERMDVTYVYPTSDMGKKNLWKAKTNDGIKFTDFIPMEIRKRRNKNDDGLNDTDRSVELINGSIIRLDTGENPDRLRGANSKLYVLSEYAEMDPEVFDVIQPVVEANGGQILVNFTPKGDNHARGSFNTWVDDSAWFTQVITANDTDVFTTEQLMRIKLGIIERFRQQGRSEQEAISYYEQEYFCNFDTPVVGSYYGEALSNLEAENRRTNVPYEPNLPVNTYWDIGVGDSTSIWFVQQAGIEVRFIDYYENSGEGLQHYMKVLQSKGYVYGEHYAPHDIEVREFANNAMSRLQTARQLGLNFKITPNLSIEDGINAARALLTRSWFDKDKTDRGYSAIKNYHKDWDDKNKVYRDKPKHDWSSHGSDALRYAAINIRPMNKANNAYIDDISDVPIYARTANMQPINDINRRVGQRLGGYRA